MASTFPTTLDNFPTNHADGVNEIIHAADINNLADAVNKIEPKVISGVGDTTYRIFSDGTNVWATSSVAGLADVPSNIDGGAVLTACLNNMSASTTPRGTIVFAPNSNFPWRSTPVIRRTYASGGVDDNKWLRIIGSGSSVIKLNTGGRQFIGFNRQADYDGFCGVEIGNLEFDDQNNTPNSDCIIGTRTDAGQIGLQRVDFRRIWIHDCDAYNMITGTLVQNKLKGFFWLESVHLTASEGTQNQITEVAVERCRVRGGSYGVLVAGFNNANTAGCNIYGDRWYVRDFYWNSNAETTIDAITPGSGIQLGGFEFGDTMVIERVTLIGSGDDGIEVNNFKNVIVRDSYVKGCMTGCFSPIQFNFVNGVDNTAARQQQYVFENCTAEVSYAGQPTGQLGHGFTIQTFGTNGCDTGTFIFRNCKTKCSAKLACSTVATLAESGSGFYYSSGITQNVDRIILENCQFDHWYDTTDGNQHNAVAIWFYKLARETIIKNCEVTLRGAQVSGTYFAQAAHINGAAVDGPCRLNIDGFLLTDLTTGRINTTTYNLYLGGDVASSFMGTIRRVCQNIATSDVQPRGIYVAGTATLTLGKLLIEDCDYTRVPSLNSFLFFNVAGQNEGKVFVRNLKSNTDPPAEIAFTPGATTVAAQYLGHYEGLMTVTGGTVTAVSVSTDNVTYRQVAAGSNTSFYIDHGMYVKITYTVVPTCAVIPRR